MHGSRRIRAVQTDVRSGGRAAAAWPERLRRTLAIRTIWLVAIAFGLYAGQWLAVLGFLPAIATQAGVSGVVLGVLTALVAAVNVVGNIAAGRLLHAGVAPPTLLRVGFVAMALGAVAAFAGDAGAGLPPALRFAALLLFSMFGGLIPTTLFALAVPLAPSEDTIATTLGWVQQWSAFGQFAGPPLVAWFASVALGWHWTWLVTAGFSVLGLVLVARIARA